ncbi:hypothetical protein PUN28_005104 [Cardiocondyla obscurior]|uniref:Uncharacterized protein n=1 Tax=Cardiocondyla obscurior TaxID=286306 RepID=A0AAW2GI62_9HYME
MQLHPRAATRPRVSSRPRDRREADKDSRDVGETCASHHYAIYIWRNRYVRQSALRAMTFDFFFSPSSTQHRKYRSYAESAAFAANRSGIIYASRDHTDISSGPRGTR